jgi:hypothetical protein
MYKSYATTAQKQYTSCIKTEHPQIIRYTNLLIINLSAAGTALAPIDHHHY